MLEVWLLLFVGRVFCPLGFPLYDGTWFAWVNGSTCFDSYNRSAWLVVISRLWVEFPRSLLAVVAGYFLARQVFPLSLSERDSCRNLRDIVWQEGLSLGWDLEVYFNSHLYTHRASHDALLPDLCPPCVTKRCLLFDRLISCCIRRWRLSGRVDVPGNANWKFCVRKYCQCEHLYGQTDKFVSTKSTRRDV